MVEMGLIWLFISAFVSATLFPGGSEILLTSMISQGYWSGASLLWWASIGNTLGSLTSWGLGWLATFKKQPSDFNGRGQQKALAWLAKKGDICLLLAWLPVIGDGLCLLAGWLRLPFWRCALYIAIGKFVRYALIYLLAKQII